MGFRSKLLYYCFHWKGVKIGRLHSVRKEHCTFLHCKVCSKHETAGVILKTENVIFYLLCVPFVMFKVHNRIWYCLWQLLQEKEFDFLVDQSFIAIHFLSVRNRPIKQQPNNDQRYFGSHPASKEGWKRRLTLQVNAEWRALSHSGLKWTEIKSSQIVDRAPKGFTRPLNHTS